MNLRLMSEKLSDWFEPSVKPSIPGWYEREYPLAWARDCFDYWNGEHFQVGNGEGAKMGPAKQKLRWRGLAEKPTPTEAHAATKQNKGADHA